MASLQFAKPRSVQDPSECFFYHRIDISNVGTFGEQWDLRQCTDRYLGNVAFDGKRVLDVGTASGFLTFAMEARGADVVSFDMADGSQWDLVPRARTGGSGERVGDCVTAHRRLQNAYWYCHERLKSKARAYYGNIYELPEELGRFDVVFMGMILSHLRHPFDALEQACRLSDDYVVVTNKNLPLPFSVSRFIPSQKNTIDDVWWSFSTKCLSQMLGVLGFEVERTVKCRPLCMVPYYKGRKSCTAIVARRVTNAGLRQQRRAA